MLRDDTEEKFWANVRSVGDSFRQALARCICVINGKGGTGKTTCCCNLAATMARLLVSAGSKKRVLCLEFDAQANLKTDFGAMGLPGDDDGQSMLHALHGVGGLKLIRDVRPGLDLVPAGADGLDEMVQVLSSCSDQKRAQYWLNFAAALAAIADEYEYIFIDCPPGDKQLQKLAMALSRWLIIPSVFDKASRYGLPQIAKLFGEVFRVNQDLDVLGILMFAFERREERVIRDKETHEVVEIKEVGQRRRLRKLLEADLARGNDDPPPVFKTVIGASKVAAEMCREMGRATYELADLVESDEWQTAKKAVALKLGGPVTITKDTAEALATDYQNLTVEVVQEVRRMEALAA